jgi:FKBP-type peptidyl-prolyl cis-trans isomerase
MVAAALIIFTGCGSSSSSKSSSTEATQTTRTGAAAVPILREPFSKPANPGPHPGARVTSLVVKDVVRGSGPEIQSGDTGIFDFIATNWITGRSIESSWQRKRPFETRIEHGVVIDGWWQGIPGMRVGGERRLLLPPELGFVQETSNPEVAGATVYYDVVLLGIRPLQPPGMGGGREASAAQPTPVPIPGG